MPEPVGTARRIAVALAQRRRSDLMPAAKQILPPGDFREWDEIEAWASEIAAELLAKVPA